MIEAGPKQTARAESMFGCLAGVAIYSPSNVISPLHNNPSVLVGVSSI